MTSSTSNVNTSASGLASISGLASGIDTTSLVKNLLALEAAPQTLLKGKLSTGQAQLSALQAINAKLASLTTSAAALSGGTALKTMSVSATSAGDTTAAKVATATITGTPIATTLDVKVNTTAQAEQRQFTGSATTTPGWAPPSRTGTFPITMTAGGQTKTFTATSYSAADVAAAINANFTGVNAVPVPGDGGATNLLVTAPPGDYPGFSLTLKDGSNNDVVSGEAADSGTTRGTAGRDASISVNGITRTSKSNTFTGVIDGLDLTIAGSAPNNTSVSVVTTRDVAATATSVSNVVSQIAAVLSDIDFHTTSPAPGTKASSVNGGLLAGNSVLRSVSDALTKAVSDAAAAVGATTADTGIEVKSDGSVAVDSTKLTAFITKNPALSTTLLTQLGTTVNTVASQASLSGDEKSPTTGTVSRLIAAMQTSNTRLSSDISAWDVRLAIRSKTLTAQYSAMETALSKLQSQSSALTAALKQLEPNN
ncbi:flagellar hook-associated protein 2 [Quadrisphaera granulorum]|uniref:Flagellar hook-associated protein 2 n=1 Tax=Quadrisphaera granulorum TaxID=317664 RepID=A0A316A554_9ACTN|nr:flagellar filament capping protein FliD [Quadrisphaera granulorum]PWJ52602.1 flagellar hook-associated protein 2 [Quadrisphaera granulorum]SZE97652.1 flagellar hook-associated protein 2 [Quadrisphaera granulorum]